MLRELELPSKSNFSGLGSFPALIDALPDQLTLEFR
jgi:hypothetical protein